MEEGKRIIKKILKGDSCYNKKEKVNLGWWEDNIKEKELLGRKKTFSEVYDLRSQWG